MTEAIGVILIIVILIAMFATAIYFGHQDDKLHVKKSKAIKGFLESHEKLVKSHNELMETVDREKREQMK